jgi:hypothetical protein
MKREKEIERLINDLRSYQIRISHLLASMYDDQDWQPDKNDWSFRYIAAHMATVEVDCYKDRIIRIASGEDPHFESYFNTGWDFSQLDLNESIHRWAVTRQEIIDLLSALPEEKWSLVGTHSAFGTITLIDVLQMMHDHDREHFQDLQQMVDKFESL